MDSRVRQQLIDINVVFYQTFADQFSATRQRIQPGVYQILKEIGLEQSILDIGCGNGNLWIALRQMGYRGKYVGVDFSPRLIQLAVNETAEAMKDSPATSPPAFFPVDLSRDGWYNRIKGTSYDIITAFAVLHHFPDEILRVEILKALRGLLKPDGWMAISVWQFLNSSRLRSRIVDWSHAGVPPEMLDHGDYLLDWRRGGQGLRYAHQFDEEELKGIASKSGFKIIKTFFSDGAEGNLGLYQTWVVQN